MVVRTRAPAWHEDMVVLANQRPVPRRFLDARQPVPVTVTMVWPTGVEVYETVALSWTREVVRVDTNRERRLNLNAVWLPVADVRRR